MPEFHFPTAPFSMPDFQYHFHQIYGKIMYDSTIDDILDILPNPDCGADIPVSEMICQQVFTISKRSANHFANKYALEYKSKES